MYQYLLWRFKIYQYFSLLNASFSTWQHWREKNSKNIAHWHFICISSISYETICPKICSFVVVVLYWKMCYVNWIASIFLNRLYESMECECFWIGSIVRKYTQQLYTPAQCYLNEIFISHFLRSHIYINETKTIPMQTYGRLFHLIHVMYAIRFSQDIKYIVRYVQFDRVISNLLNGIWNVKSALIHLIYFIFFYWIHPVIIVYHNLIELNRKKCDEKCSS